MQNNEDIFRPFLDEKGLKFIKQFRLRTNLTLPDSFLKTLNFIPITWNSTMKMYKLSEIYFGDPNDWWIIALVNKKPTDFNWKVGDVVLIPTDPYAVKRFVENQ